MSTSGSVDGISLDQILEPVRRYWGYDSLRPLQEEAIRAGLSGRDSVVVMPTGGGKSLCYQVPPVTANRTDIVVSPLISLMKDQVDGLRACDYPAVALNSAMEPESHREAIADIRAGKCRLVFVSPERLLMDSFLDLAEQIDVGAFAIDEAHCISQWGHDFRPEYRRLALLKERFPKTSVHAYTATATQRVREDIANQLHLTEPAMIVGRFDRPNLTYRVVPRVDVHAQTIDAIRRHHNEAVIVYCLSRKDTEAMADALMSSGITASPYHAGLSPDRRRRVQEAFAKESLNVVTATVAFGMGIDRSNVRCVIHATMPKSVEHYVQETGRAGRDGLEAECVLLYSGSDVMRWESLLRRSADEASDSRSALDAQVELLHRMRRFCGVPRCRHRALSEYFDQPYETENCSACDVCLEEMEGIEDGTETARKILSCVARVGECFGAGHVADVLVGADTERIRERGHDQLSTFGLIKTMPKKAVMNCVYQLVDQDLLERTRDDRPVLSLNDASWEVMRGNRRVSLIRPKAKVVTKTRGAVASWEGVDRGLFEHLRGVRRELADERGAPAFVIFGDASLRDMARTKPDSPEAFRQVHGVGEAKLKQFGTRFLAEIEAYQGQ
ncbi:MAG: DNA helicase RecQ [Planctomycetes bacterium]|nr:DNA helicase RecQ [Planctomycetota bacterium]